MRYVVIDTESRVVVTNALPKDPACSFAEWLSGNFNWHTHGSGWSAILETRLKQRGYLLSLWESTGGR